MVSNKEEKSKIKFKKVIEHEVTQMFETILDYTQVACAAPDTFKVLRARILRAGNDCIRKLSNNLDNYTVNYDSSSEDVIVVKKRG